MSLRSQDYAALADDAYKDHPVGRWAPHEAEVAPIGDHNYRILEHVNNKNGYQGFIYQLRTSRILEACNWYSELRMRRHVQRTT